MAEPYVVHEGAPSGVGGCPHLTTEQSLEPLNMKKIQVLGTGCPSCRRLAELTEQVARELQIEYELEKVTEIERIVAFGVVATPALVVDGDVKASGQVPGLDELKALLR